MTNRRGFLAGILALGASPAIVRADSLMRIVVPQTVRFKVAGRYDFDALGRYRAEQLAKSLQFTQQSLEDQIAQLYHEEAIAVQPTKLLVPKAAFAQAGRILGVAVFVHPTIVHATPRAVQLERKLK